MAETYFKIRSGVIISCDPEDLASKLQQKHVEFMIQSREQGIPSTTQATWVYTKLLYFILDSLTIAGPIDKEQYTTDMLTIRSLIFKWIGQ